MKNNDNLQCLEMFETVKGSIGDTLQIVVIQGPGISGGGGKVTNRFPILQKSAKNRIHITRTRGFVSFETGLWIRIHMDPHSITLLKNLRKKPRKNA